MPLYLTAESVAESLSRLQRSAAQTRLCDFLIGLRTLTLSGTDHVQVAESIPQYTKAVNELTKCVPDGVTTTFSGEPYITPFGTARGKDAGRAYKGPKFPSNGPSNTFHGWATQQDSPFDILGGRPKGIQRRTVTQDQLRKFFLLKGAKLDERPRLLDAAVWYFRASDLETRFGSEPTEAQLTEAFVDAIALTIDDINALFITEEQEDQSAD